MTDQEKLQKSLDLHQPDWWISFATQQDLRDFARNVAIQGISSGRAIESLRQVVSIRLMTPVRASLDAGLTVLAQ